VIIPAGHILKSGYVNTSEIVFPHHHADPMAVAAVEDKVRQYTSIKEGSAYPLPIIEWIDGKPVLKDGRHRYIASLMLGRKTMLVAWVEPVST
jgi:hypothetical protein